jgi:hypothetical protein
MFRCQRKTPAHIKIALVKGTLFENYQMQIEKILSVIYLFTIRSSYESVRRETFDWVNNVEISDNTIADWYSNCREICLCALDDAFEARGKLGGPGFFVEIDEMKFGKRKHHVGRVVEGQWIFGMILHGSNERPEELRHEICPNNRRDSDTLLSLVKKHVALGTTIISDCWAAYNCLNNEGFNHLTVNHSYNFNDPDTWANTQKIESIWRQLRTRLARGGVRSEYLGDHLCEFLWHREIRKRGLDPFSDFLKEICKVYPQ